MKTDYLLYCAGVLLGLGLSLLLIEPFMYFLMWLLPFATLHPVEAFAGMAIFSFSTIAVIHTSTH